MDKSPYPRSHISHLTSITVEKLYFFHGNGIKLTDLNTAFTTQALVFIYGFSLALNQFVYIHGTDVRAFSIAGAFVFVYSYFPHNLIPPYGFGSMIRKVPKVC